MREHSWPKLARSSSQVYFSKINLTLTVKLNFMFLSLSLTLTIGILSTCYNCVDSLSLTSFFFFWYWQTYLIHYSPHLFGSEGLTESSTIVLETFCQSHWLTIAAQILKLAFLIFVRFQVITHLAKRDYKLLLILWYRLILEMSQRKKCTEFNVIFYLSKNHWEQWAEAL